MNAQNNKTNEQELNQTADSVIATAKKDNFSNEWRPFEEAREFVRSLGLKTIGDWKRYCENKIPTLEKKPVDIPNNPQIQYRKDCWKNMDDWLSERIMPFAKARAFAIKLNLQGTLVKEYEAEWKKYCKGELEGLPPKPANIPVDVKNFYRKDWITWEDWLTGKATKIRGEWRPFEEAREFIRNLKLKGQIEWKQYCNGILDGYTPKPNDIPVTPDMVYKNNGWIDYSDWLGTTRKRRGRDLDNDTTWLPYEEAKEFVQSLKLKDYTQWIQYINNELELPTKPNDIPNSPYFVYKDSGWKNMSDWLGNGFKGKRRVVNALPYEEARKFIRSLGLKNTYEWNDYIKGTLSHLPPIPTNIPKNPYMFYRKNGWIKFADWLGIASNG